MAVNELDCWTRQVPAAPGDLDRDIQDSLDRHRPTVYLLPEGFAFIEPHDEERPAVVLSQLMDRADAGMLQCGGRLGFVEEAFPCGLIVRDMTKPTGVGLPCRLNWCAADGGLAEP